MSLKLPIPAFQELAPTSPEPQLPQAVKRPQYGRVLEDFTEGAVFWHPRGITIYPAFAVEFATTFMEANPLYLNREYAIAHGYRDLVVSPLMVMNIALSLGVQNDSEKAMANLGYYNMHFLRPVYPGDTLRGATKVTARKLRGNDPGIVSIRTLALNQKNEVVIQYDRKIMVKPAGAASAALPPAGEAFPDSDTLAMDCPVNGGKYPHRLTGTATYFEDFAEGDVVVHKNGRTVTDEHMPWTYRVMNTHPLHFDKLYSQGLSGAMSGEPIAYGGLLFAWLCGLASRDASENALCDLGYTEGYHTQPSVSGDTLTAVSRVLKKEAGPAGLKASIVTFQLIGLKNMRPEAAIEKHGAALFVKENNKKALNLEKIPEKIFEIERRLLIKHRAYDA